MGVKMDAKRTARLKFDLRRLIFRQETDFVPVDGELRDREARKTFEQQQ